MVSKILIMGFIMVGKVEKKRDIYCPLVKTKPSKVLTEVDTLDAF